MRNTCTYKRCDAIVEEGVLSRCPLLNEVTSVDNSVFYPEGLITRLHF
jgi:hypothetical protein